MNWCRSTSRLTTSITVPRPPSLRSNDLSMAANSGHVSALCLLDLTATFDTVDHDLLRLRLERQFGLRGIPLLWFTSYLQDRSYRVLYSGSTSATVWLICSVPLESMLGLRLFTMYAADLVDRVEKHGIKFHGYADDFQLYVHCRPHDMAWPRQNSKAASRT